MTGIVGGCRTGIVGGYRAGICGGNFGVWIDGIRGFCCGINLLLKGFSLKLFLG